MTKEREALALALEALELHGKQYPHMVKGIAAIKEALAQPSDSVEQEPVATVQCIHGVTIGYLDVMQPVGAKLYITPPKRGWVGLSAADMREITLVCIDKASAMLMTEDKLKELNHD